MPDSPETIPDDLPEELPRDPEALRASLALVHPIDLAEDLNDMDLEERVRIFEALDPERAALVLSAMPHEGKVGIVDKLGEEKLADVIDRMPDYAVADIIDHLPAHKERKVMAQLQEDHASDIQQLRQYPPNTAGGRMTRNFVSVPDTFTSGETIKAIQGSVDSHTVDFIYVVDEEGRLRGVCSLHKLMIHPPETHVAQFMRKDVTFVGPTMDQEELARIAQKYRLRAVPVVDNSMKILGVVTLQDIIEVIQQEAGEDMMKMAGSVMVDTLATPTLTRFRLRLPWLFLTLGGELFIAIVIGKLFKTTLERASILAAFMPAITATGGNVGIQCTTLIVRARGMGTLKTGQVFRVLSHELRLGVLLGLTCGLAAALFSMLFFQSHHQVGRLSLAVFLAMVSATIATSIVGALEPMVLHRLKFDPATACGPFVTMFNDLFGTSVYFLIALLLDIST